MFTLPPHTHPQADSTQLLQGPYLHLAAVPQWGPACIVSHRKAADEHVQVLQLGGGGFGSGAAAADPTAPPLEVLVTGDTTRIALPSAPDGGDNFVVGLAIDTSCDTVGDAGS